MPQGKRNGFRKNKSTETASQTFIESIQEAMDKQLHVVGIFFDLTKAYDVRDVGIELYSKVSNRIKNSASFSAFKKGLKSFLLEHSFYTISEFIGFNKRVNGVSKV
jgi:hypothetical protein